MDITATKKAFARIALAGSILAPASAFAENKYEAKPTISPVGLATQCFELTEGTVDSFLEKYRGEKLIFDSATSGNPQPIRVYKDPEDQSMSVVAVSARHQNRGCFLGSTSVSEGIQKPIESIQTQYSDAPIKRSVVVNTQITSVCSETNAPSIKDHFERNNDVEQTETGIVSINGKFEMSVFTRKNNEESLVVIDFSKATPYVSGCILGIDMNIDKNTTQKNETPDLPFKIPTNVRSYAI